MITRVATVACAPPGSDPLPATDAANTSARRSLADAQRDAAAHGRTLSVPKLLEPFAGVMFEHRHPETNQPVYLHHHGEAVFPAPQTGRAVTLPRVTVDDDELRLAFFGDSGKDTDDQRAVTEGIEAHVRTDRIHAAVHVGDAFYENGLANVEDPKFQRLFNDHYDRLPVPVYFMLGNHEYGNSDRAGSVEAVLRLAEAGASERMVFPSRYYCAGYDLKDGTTVDVFVLDTSVIASEPEQLRWLAEGLKTSQATRRIVVGHHPLHSYGLHGDQRHLQLLLLPLLEKHADLYVCGHEHDQQVLESDGGLPLIVTGAAGEMRNTGTGPRQRFGSGDGMLGFATVTIAKAGLSLTIRDDEGDAVYQHKASGRESRRLRNPVAARHPQLQTLETRL